MPAPLPHKTWYALVSTGTGKQPCKVPCDSMEKIRAYLDAFRFRASNVGHASQYLDAAETTVWQWTGYMAWRRALAGETSFGERVCGWRGV